MAVSIKFERCGVGPDSEPRYRLLIGGRLIREDMRIDQVVEAINRRDEERLGDDHSARGGGRDGHDYV